MCVCVCRWERGKTVRAWLCVRASDRVSVCGVGCFTSMLSSSVTWWRASTDTPPASSPHRHKKGNVSLPLLRFNLNEPSHTPPGPGPFPAQTSFLRTALTKTGGAAWPEFMSGLNFVVPGPEQVTLKCTPPLLKVNLCGHVSLMSPVLVSLRRGGTSGVTLHLPHL